MHRITRLMAIALMMVAVAVPGFTQKDPTGREIMTNVFERSQPEDMQGSLTMTLENARGAQRVRNIRQYVARFGNVEKKLLFFTAPADVRDTAFMNWSHDNPSTPDDQWIYLPALGRVRRISAEKKNDSFMGSDFTYEDLSARHPDLDTHRLLGTEVVDGRTVYVVESVPNNGTAYHHTVSRIVEDIWIGLRREFYDASDKLLKTLEINDYQQIDGFWTITRMTMTDEKTGHFTIMELSDQQFNKGLDEGSFSERSMTRGVR